MNNKLPKAFVVFTGKTDMPWLKLLKPGFRHCYVLLNDGKNWLSLDPLSNYMDVSIHHSVPPDFDLPRWMQARGHAVMPAKLCREKKEAPWMIFTCVEAVKRVLGIHRRFILTPWQLYQYLLTVDSGRWTELSGRSLSTAHRPPLQKGEPAWEV